MENDQSNKSQVLTISCKLQPQFLKLVKSNKKVFVYKGGRGGGKSYAIADFIIGRCVTGRESVYCGRVIKSTVDINMRIIFEERLKYFNEKLIESGILKAGKVFYNVTNKGVDFMHMNNASKIYFVGFGDKTIEQITSTNISIAWVDECHNITKRQLDRLIPSIRFGDNTRVIFSYNPQFRTDDILKESEIHKDTWEVITTNFSDNKYFMSNATLVQLYEDDKKLMEEGQISEAKFNHIWHGEPFVEDEEVLITYGMIQKNLEYLSQDYKNFKICMGVDVALTDNDYSVILIRQGNKIKDIIRMKNKDGYALAQEIVKFKKIYGVNFIMIDSIGVGASPCSVLKNLFHENIFEVNNGMQARDKSKFYNIRAESYSKIKDMLLKGFDFGDGYDVEYKEELIKQLSFVPYKIDNSNRVQIEKKEFIKKVIGCSPDIADALALTYSTDIDDYDVRNVVGGNIMYDDYTPLEFNIDIGL
jgi:PBSX family phage terminase large subunit